MLENLNSGPLPEGGCHCHTGQKPVFLVDLVELDEAVGPIADIVPQCFGDRYLCENNAIYASLRRSFMSLGGTFDLSLGQVVDLCPIITISVLTREGRVPVSDTWNTVKKLVADQPTLRGSISGLMQKNRLLYRTARFVATKRLEARVPEIPRYSRGCISVAIQLLADAYATVAELIGVYYARSDEHRLFYAANCHLLPGRQPPLLNCARVLGPERTFLLAMIAELRIRLGATWDEASIAHAVGAWQTTGYVDDLDQSTAAAEYLRFTQATILGSIDQTLYDYFEHQNLAQEYALLCGPGGTEWREEISAAFEWVMEVIDEAFA